MRRLIFGFTIAAAVLVLVVGSVLWANRAKDRPPVVADNMPEPKKDDRNDTPRSAETKPAGKREARIETAWEGRVRYLPDSPPTNCGVAGRVRLFTADTDTPHKGAGLLTVMLFDTTPKPGMFEPVLKEEWRIESAQLDYFLAKDAATPEYRFVLPWGSYAAEIEQIRIDVKFEPASGPALTARTEVMTIDHGAIKER